MEKTLEKGSMVEGLLALLALSIMIFAILIPKSARLDLTGWPDAFQFGNTPGTSYYKGSQSQDSAGQTSSTATADAIYLSTGNARYVSDPMSEYVTVENRGAVPLNITGWRLENGKSLRSYTFGSQSVHYASDVGLIPQGTKIISPRGGSALEDIILKPNEKAVIVSGGPGNLSGPQVVSFKENSCTGYLAEDYSFPTGIEKSCIYPSQEPGLSSLDSSCKRYVESMRSCHTPKYDGVKYNRERCIGCVDGTEGLSSSCTAFIKSRFSYEGCLANHQGDQNFEGRIWYVYLYRPWEMWADRDEVVSLYDSTGKLINKIEY
jgi:hypothetical protein